MPKFLPVSPGDDEDGDTTSRHSRTSSGGDRRDHDADHTASNTASNGGGGGGGVGGGGGRRPRRLLPPRPTRHSSAPPAIPSLSKGLSRKSGSGGIAPPAWEPAALPTAARSASPPAKPGARAAAATTAAAAAPAPTSPTAPPSIAATITPPHHKTHKRSKSNTSTNSRSRRDAVPAHAYSAEARGVDSPINLPLDDQQIQQHADHLAGKLINDSIHDNGSPRGRDDAGDLQAADDGDGWFAAVPSVKSFTSARMSLLAPTLFTESLPKNVICMLCDELFEEPVIAKCGHTFCAQCLLELPPGGQCPAHQQTLIVPRMGGLIPNITVIDQISELDIKCMHGIEEVEVEADVDKGNGDGTGNANSLVELQLVDKPGGCPETIKLGNRAVHESECGFAPVRCPNSPQCPPMLRRDLADHLAACTFYRCPQHLHGCTYSGAHDELEVHAATCVHRPNSRAAPHANGGDGSGGAAANGADAGGGGATEEGGGGGAPAALDELASSSASTATLRAARGSPDAIAAASAAVASVTTGIMEQHDLQVEELVERMEQKDDEVGELNDAVVALSDRLTRLEEMCLLRVESLETNANALADGTTNVNLAIDDVAEEIGRMQEVLGMQPGPAFEDGDLDAFKCKGTFMGHAGPIWAFAVNNETLFSGSSDQTIKAWDTSAGSNFVCKKTLCTHEGIIHSLICYDRKLYSGSADQTINVWDVGSLELIDTLRGHDGPVCSLATANGMLFSGSHKIIKVWDIYTHSLIGELTGLPHWVRCLSTSHDKLYAGSSLSISMWATKRQGLGGLQEAFDSGANPPALDVVQTSGGSVYSIYATPTKVICGTSAHVVHVFDTATLEELAVLDGHSGTIYSVAVMAESFGMASVMFSASFDSTIKVWDLDTLECIQTLRKHDDSTNAIAVQQDWLFSGAADNTIKVWSRD